MITALRVILNQQYYLWDYLCVSSLSVMCVCYVRNVEQGTMLLHTPLVRSPPDDEA